MANWFHRFFNPHCEHCMEERAIERDESRVCSSCEVLRRELESLRSQNRELLQTILEPLRPQPIVQPLSEPEPIKSKIVPWNVKRQMIEAEDKRKAAELQRNAPKPINELEKEVLGAENISDSKS